MSIDPSIALQARSPQFTDPLELAGKTMSLRNLALGGQAQQLSIDQAQRSAQQERVLADLYRSNVGQDGQVNTEGVIRGMASSGLGEKIPAYQKQITDAQKSRTDAQGATLDVQKKKLDIVNGSLASLLAKPDLNHDDVIRTISGWVDNGVLSPEEGAQRVKELPGPDGLRSFLVQKAVQAQDAGKRLESMLPKLTPVNTGGSEQLVDTNPLTRDPNAPTTFAKTQSPDSRATIAKDYAVAGLNPDGSLSHADSALVDQIGQNRIIPSARLQATPRGQAILAQVEAKYPGYDITTAEAKQKAAKDFTSGTQGNALRSIGTASKHLDMLGNLVDALGNNDTQLFNRIGNAVAAQTGNPAPTNFDAAKQIVSQEVIKAIVANGGGVSEREEAAKALSNAQSPAQLKGVIATYKSIMGAQHESLLQQRRAAGLSDSTLANYAEGATGTSARSGSRPPLDAILGPAK